MKIQGTGALVTGASRGLGRALAEALAAKGARVAMVARDAGPLADAVARIASDRVLAESLVTEAHALVESRFTLRGMLASYERLFTATVAS